MPSTLVTRLTNGGNFLTNSTVDEVTKKGATSVESYGNGSSTSSYFVSGNLDEVTNYGLVPNPGGSIYFSGSATSLLSNTGSIFTLYSSFSPFTLEAWIYPLTSSTQTIVSIGNEANNRMAFGITNASNSATLFYNLYGYSSVYLSPISTGTWSHIAFVSNSTPGGVLSTASILTSYVNGVAGASFVISTSTNTTTSTSIGSLTSTTNSDPGIFIGGSSNTGTYQGYMSSLRYINNTAVYTGNFTPSVAPLKTVYNAQLLLAVANSSSYITDSSGNGFTLINSGTVAYSTLTPFLSAPQKRVSNTGTCQISGFFDELTINSSSGYIHGQTYSITTSGTFGTRVSYNYNNYTWQGQQHLHYMWTAFDQGQPLTYTDAGWNAVIGGMTAIWNNYGSVQTVPAPNIIENMDGIFPANISAGGYFFQASSNPPPAPGVSDRYHLGLLENMSGFTGTNYAGEYISYKLKVNGPSSGLAANNNIFLRRVFGPTTVYTSATSLGQVQFIIGVNSLTPSLQLNIVNGNTGSILTTSTNFNPTANIAGSLGLGQSTTTNIAPDWTNWNRYEHRILAGSATTATLLRNRINQKTMYAQSSSLPAQNSNSNIDIPIIIPNYPALAYAGTAFSNSTTWFAATTATENGNGALVNYGGNVLSTPDAYYGSPNAFNVTDIYHDLTWARVEITDGTYSEPQILTSWTATQITFLFNRGQLTSGINRTLNVYDANETVIYSTLVTVV